MTLQEAAQRLAQALNEIGAEGIQVEEPTGGFCLSTGSDLQHTFVSSVNATDTAWEVE